MRKMVYVGYNRKLDEGIETTSYQQMLDYKAKGYVFTIRLDEIVKERIPLDEWKRQKAERDEHIRAKRALNAIMAGV